MSKWVKTTHPGVRYREHPTRKYNRQKDKYFEIRYQRTGESISEALGWLSDGMTPLEASQLRGEVIQNIKKGLSPQSVAEMREIKEATKQAERAQEEADQRYKFTFGEAAGLFLEWSENNKKSYRDDKNRYEKHLEPRFKDVPIKDLSPFALERLKASLIKKKLSPGTITQCLQLTRAIFRKTKGWGRHDFDFPKVDFPRVSNQRVAFLTQDQARALLDAVKKKSVQLWCQCILSLYAGLRFKEIASLELSDLDFEAGTIHVRDSKGGTRHAYITEPIRAMFDEWWTVADKKPGLIFPAWPGGRKATEEKKKRKLKPFSIQKRGRRQVRVSPVFARTVDELKLNDGITDSRQKVVFHTLRHTFASWLVMGGESLQTVQELMGHKDITTTMRYSHLAPDIKRNAVQNLVATLNQGNNENKVVNLNDKKWSVFGDRATARKPAYLGRPSPDQLSRRHCRGVFELKLIDFYETQSPIWDAARVQELFEIARKNYPDIKSIDDAIIQADGAHLKELPFHLLSLTIVFPTKLLSRTKKKFCLGGRHLPDWIKPHVLAFDAKALMKMDKSFNQIKDHHRTLVEAITTFKIWTQALNYRLSKELYGQHIIELVIRKDPNARKELFAMLGVGPTDRDVVKSEANLCIASSVNKSKKEAPPLESFLNNIGLPDHDRVKITKILQGKNTQEAKLFSDAIAGVFRCLPGEFENDLKNYKEKCRTEKHKFHDSTLSIDEKAKDNSRLIPKDSCFEKRLNLKLSFDRLSEELEKPQYIKIKPIFDAVFRHPEISDSDLAEICGIHRNTAPKRRKELKTIYKKLVNS